MGGISGTVSETGGGPLANVRVEVFQNDGPLVTDDCTAAGGTYLFNNLPAPAQYQVRFAGGAPCPLGPANFAPEWFTAGGGTPRRDFAELVPVVDGIVSSPFNGSIQDGSEINGTVTAAGGGPLANVTVDLFEAARGHVMTKCTAGDGTYRLDPLNGGVYSVRFTPNGSCGNAGNFDVQWFDGSATQAGSDAVFIGNNPGEVVNNINGALLPAGSGGDEPAPDTTIDRSTIKARKGRATFSFSASGGTAPVGFECSRVKKGAEAKFTSCGSPKSYRNLKKGTYTFEVRAVDAAGRVDESPASKTFKSKRKKR